MGGERGEDKAGIFPVGARHSLSRNFLASMVGLNQPNIQCKCVLANASPLRARGNRIPYSRIHAHFPPAIHPIAPRLAASARM